jgi:hypothetical protein
MAEFKRPELLTTTGALTYVRGPGGEALGAGYHGYDVLTGADTAGDEATMLVAWRGASRVILSSHTYEPLVGSLSGEDKPTFWEYTILDGTLYGYKYLDDGMTDLGAWPPIDPSDIGE